MYCNLQITYYFLLFLSRTILFLFSTVYRKNGVLRLLQGRSRRRGVESSVRFAERMQVNSQLLALLVKVAALQTQRSRNLGHVKIVPLDFSKQHFFFKGFGALCECSRLSRAGIG